MLIWLLSTIVLLTSSTQLFGQYWTDIPLRHFVRWPLSSFFWRMFSCKLFTAFPTVAEEKVRDIRRRVLDLITTSLFECLDVVLFDLEIMNRSLAYGAFSDAYRSEPVIPVFKKLTLDHSDIKCFRSVCNLPIISNSTEKIFVWKQSIKFQFIAVCIQARLQYGDHISENRQRSAVALA